MPGLLPDDSQLPAHGDKDDDGYDGDDDDDNNDEDDDDDDDDIRLTSPH